MTEHERRESDQLPEEQPEEVAPEGEKGSPERRQSPGVPGEEGTGTGNPDAAGAEEPDE